MTQQGASILIVDDEQNLRRSLSLILQREGYQVTTAGNAAEGCYFSTMALAYGAADSDIDRFNSAFKAKFGEEPDQNWPAEWDSEPVLPEKYRA